MTDSIPLAGLRREYGDSSFSDADAMTCPIAQFKHWFSDVLKFEKNDPTAMLLSTVDEQGYPDSRVVLLKSIDEGAFVFYTNYESTKALQMNKNAHVALNFFWPGMVRQVRIRGHATRVSESQSDEYFASRPKNSQLSAIVSPQSREISGRAELERTFNDLIASHQQALVMRPIHWGGYKIVPDAFEFWQGRDNRLHDRIQYYRDQGKWRHRRLAP